MKPQKLPYDKFLESFKLAPRIAVDLLIKNEKFFFEPPEPLIPAHRHIFLNN